jgi:hypothetical protein
MNAENKIRKPRESLRQIRRNQPRMTLEEALLQNQRMMRATPNGSNRTSENKSG